MTGHGTPPQLGFDALLADAENENRARKFERETGHLPGTMEEALPFYRLLLRQHHAAMLAANVDEAMRLREDADKLALRLNGGEPGILAGPDAPGHVLERESAAALGAVPLWGQTGEFVIIVGSMNVRIELDGMFGITSIEARSRLLDPDDRGELAAWLAEYSRGASWRRTARRSSWRALVRRHRDDRVA